MFPWQLQAMLLETARQTSQHSAADLATQHGLCCVRRHALPKKEGHVSEDSTGRGYWHPGSEPEIECKDDLSITAECRYYI